MSRIKHAREHKALTQSAVAKAVGVSLPFYQRVEYGRATPTVGIAIRLARVLDVPVENLFRDAVKAPSRRNRSSVCT